jgi:hypothetical protein
MMQKYHSTGRERWHLVFKVELCPRDLA